MITPASSTAPHPTEMQDLRSARSVLKPTEAPEGVTLLELNPETGEPKAFAELSARIARQGQLRELASLSKKKEILEKAAQLHRMMIKNMEKQLATPPVPAEDLEGAEAARVMALAEKLAKEHNHRFPPPKDQNFVFADEDWNYTIYGDGRVTRSKSGVLTPEQWEYTAKDLKERKAVIASGVFESQIAEIDRQINDHNDKIGPMSEAELSELQVNSTPSTDFSTFFSILA